MTDLRWRPSPLALALSTCAAAALIGAVLSGQWQLAVFAAPMLGALAGTGWLAPPSQVTIECTPDSVHCFESEAVDIAVTVRVSGGSASALTAAPLPTEGMQLVGTVTTQSTVAATTAQFRLSAQRWGSYPLAIQVRATSAGGLLSTTATAPVTEVRVYPLAPPEPTAVPHPELTDRLGTHLTRRHGTGVEYADIRAYVPGDQLRTINWPVSARRGQLHVTERFTDRAADLVALIDTYPQAPGPANAALERSARGATQVVQAALQRGDRAGVIALGRRPRWLGPDIGRRQFYRVLDTVLDAGDGHSRLTGTLAPRHAVPPGATVVAFSTLLETDFGFALIDLRRRGHLVVAVDVLEGTPFTEELDPLVSQLWRLERQNMHRNLGLSGVDVIEWDGQTPLERALLQLAPARHARRPTRRLARR